MPPRALIEPETGRSLSRLREKPTTKLIGHFDKAFLHARNFRSFGFNDAAGFGGFREKPPRYMVQKRCLASSVLDVCHRER